MQMSDTRMTRGTWRWGALLGTAVLLLAAPGATAVQAGESDGAAPSAQDVQRMVDELRGELAIRYEVAVELVPSNARLLSVARNDGDRQRFRLSIEQGFFGTLTGDERRAALAHELGHVWIFTTHPYLQTESGANRIALRVVSRESLASLYQKMWAREGTTGDLARFLGEAASHDELAGLSDARR
jgi:hypothetical protein